MEKTTSKKSTTSSKKKKKSDEPQMLSSFEEDLVWMSYRYCIGRHTIAAHMHAGDVARYVYGRMNENRTQFMAFDIRREVADVLNWYGNFRLSPSIPENLYRPMDYFFEFFKDNNIKTLKDLSVYKHISVEYDYRIGKCKTTAVTGDDYRWAQNFTLRVEHNMPKEYDNPAVAYDKFFKDKGIRTHEDLKDYRFVGMSWDEETNDTKYYVERYSNEGYSLSRDFDDLLAWSALADLLDVRNHKYCKVRYNGEESVIEYFETYFRDYESGNELGYIKRKVGVKRYLASPQSYCYIDEQFIIEDNVMPPVEIDDTNE